MFKERIMKVSYIILPFTDSTYLVRCINSLYRQLGEDFEVILAENDFGDRQEEIEEFLDGMPQVLRIDFPEIETENVLNEFDEETAGSVKISSTKKLNRAFDLISEDCSYVMLIDVNTVVSPICTNSILERECSDLIIPVAAVKKGDGFVLDCPEISALQKNFDKYIPQRFCFGKELFRKFKADFIENNEAFSVFLIKALTKGISIVSTEDTAVYVQSFAVPETNENLDLDTAAEQCDDIFSKLFEIDDAEIKVVIFEKVIGRVFNLLGREEIEDRCRAYEILQEYCNRIQDDYLLKRIFEGMIGFESDVILSMDYVRFELYKTHVKGAGNPVTAIDCAVQNNLLKNMKTTLDANKNVLDLAKKELTDIKKDVLAIKAKPFAAAPVNAAGVVIGDPYIDIPKMYREGRLGFKTIWRSFWSWFKFKFGRKK